MKMPHILKMFLFSPKSAIYLVITITFGGFFKSQLYFMIAYAQVIMTYIHYGLLP